MSNLLANRVAIVTGAGKGLGRSHALAMALEGARVVVTSTPMRPGRPVKRSSATAARPSGLTPMSRN